jgi:hypothetical protein
MNSDRRQGVIVTGPDGWRNDRPESDALQASTKRSAAARRDAFRQAITSFMFNEMTGWDFR